MASFRKKLLIGLSIASMAYFAGAYYAGTSFSAYQPDHQLIGDATNSRDHEPTQISATSRKIAPTDSDATKQTLTANPTLPLAAEKIDFKELKARFTAPYPEVSAKTEAAHHDLRQKNEVVDRLRILRELKLSQEKVTKPELTQVFVSLYSLILGNTQESWLVQRQALKNMNPLWGSLSQAERNRITSGIDLRARAHWRLSDQELASMVWRQNAR